MKTLKQAIDELGSLADEFKKTYEPQVQRWNELADEAARTVLERLGLAKHYELLLSQREAADGPSFQVEIFVAPRPLPNPPLEKVATLAATDEVGARSQAEAWVKSRHGTFHWRAPAP